jgi:beta-phosphoglucomutase
LLYDAVFFDFDGVLVDSEPVHFAAWQAVLEPLGISLDWHLYQRRCVGSSDVDLLDFLAGLAPRPMRSDEMRSVYADKRGRFRTLALEAQLVSPAIRDLIGTVAASLPLAVVTSSERSEVEPILEQGKVRHHLAAAVYGDEVDRRKPAPDPYLLAARRTGARRPLVVEDTDTGETSARAAGFDVLRVRTPGEVPQRLREALQLR